MICATNVCSQNYKETLFGNFDLILAIFFSPYFGPSELDCTEKTMEWKWGEPPPPFSGENSHKIAFFVNDYLPYPFQRHLQSLEKYSGCHEYSDIF